MTEIVDYKNMQDMPESYGNQVIDLTEEELNALVAGKSVLCQINGGEYQLLITNDNIKPCSGSGGCWLEQRGIKYEADK